MKTKIESAVELGRLGGIANFKKHGKKHMAELGRKGMRKRWGKKSKNNNN